MDEKLKKILDHAESLGYNRGVLTLAKALLTAMEDEGMTAISYKSLKDISEGLLQEIKEYNETIR